MQTNEIIGYRVRTQYGSFVHAPRAHGAWVSTEEPTPISQSDAYRRLAAYIEDYPFETGFEVVPVYRVLTPLETTARELGDLLSDLTSRHGLNLGLTKDQIERKIAQELTEMGANVVVDEHGRSWWD